MRLGPCPCMGCGQPVYWDARLTRFLRGAIVREWLRWRNGDGTRHQCGGGA